MSGNNDILISIIVAVAQNGIIGREGGMPWRLSTDLKRFKSITIGAPVIMGRKTFESIGVALPSRQNIIISRDVRGIEGEGTGRKQFLQFLQFQQGEGIERAKTIEQALEIAKQSAKMNGLKEIFIIGGGEIYKQCLPLCDKLYVTYVLAMVEGDTCFPQIDLNMWRVIHDEWVARGERDNYPTRFVIYQRSPV